MYLKRDDLAIQSDLPKCNYSLPSNTHSRHDRRAGRGYPLAFERRNERTQNRVAGGFCAALSLTVCTFPFARPCITLIPNLPRSTSSQPQHCFEWRGNMDTPHVLSSSRPEIDHCQHLAGEHATTLRDENRRCLSVATQRLLRSFRLHECSGDLQRREAMSQSMPHRLQQRAARDLFLLYCLVCRDRLPTQDRVEECCRMM